MDITKLSLLALKIYELIRDSPTGYRAVWSLAEELNIPLPANFCGSGEWSITDDAMKELVDGGYIEELPDLHCRYRIKEQSSEQGSQWEDYGFTIGSFL